MTKKQMSKEDFDLSVKSARAMGADTFFPWWEKMHMHAESCDCDRLEGATEQQLRAIHKAFMDGNNSIKEKV